MAKKESLGSKHWRAKDENYYFINSDFDVDTERDFEWSSDEKRYTIGNYFKTKNKHKKLSKE